MTGSYKSATAFVDGFRFAIIGCAGFAFAGAVVAMAVPGPDRAGLP